MNYLDYKLSSARVTDEAVRKLVSSKEFKDYEMGKLSQKKE